MSHSNKSTHLEPCPLCKTPATRSGEALFCSVGCPERNCGIRVSMVGNYRVVDAAWNLMAALDNSAITG